MGEDGYIKEHKIIAGREGYGGCKRYECGLISGWKMNELLCRNKNI